MKSVRITMRAVCLCGLLLMVSFLVAILWVPSVRAAEDPQKAAESALANCEATRKLVDDAIKGQDARLKEAKPSDMLKHELEDAKMWFKKADDLLAECKKQISEKKFDTELVEKLGQVWRWYVEAGSAAIRAGQMN